MKAIVTIGYFHFEFADEGSAARIVSSLAKGKLIKQVFDEQEQRIVFQDDESDIEISVRCINPPKAKKPKKLPSTVKSLTFPGYE